MLVEDEVLVLDDSLLRLDGSRRSPDMAIVPLKPALKVLPAAQLRNIAGDAEVFAEFGLVMDAQRQIVGAVVPVGRLALLVVGAGEVDVLVLLLG